MKIYSFIRELIFNICFFKSAIIFISLQLSNWNVCKLSIVELWNFPFTYFHSFHCYPFGNCFFISHYSLLGIFKQFNKWIFDIRGPLLKNFTWQFVPSWQGEDFILLHLEYFLFWKVTEYSQLFLSCFFFFLKNKNFHLFHFFSLQLNFIILIPKSI